MLKKPAHGYGSSMNPCIDCKIYMMKKAKEMMDKYDASFIVSGEVLGQRPMSQHKAALLEIERKADVKGILLRPLSAHFFEPTLPEIEGIIDRNKLFSIEGRGRKTQLELINNFEIQDFSPVGGGCILTDKLFKKKFEDLLEHNESTKLSSLYILKFGRHFRYKNSKIVVGRSEWENNLLIKYKSDDDYILSLADIPGPIVVLRGEKSHESVNFAANLVLYYSDCNDSSSEVECSNKTDLSIIKAIKIDKESVDFYNIALKK